MPTKGKGKVKRLVPGGTNEDGQTTYRYEIKECEPDLGTIRFYEETSSEPSFSVDDCVRYVIHENGSIDDLLALPPGSCNC